MTDEKSYIKKMNTIETLLNQVMYLVFKLQEEMKENQMIKKSEE